MRSLGRVLVIVLFALSVAPPSGARASTDTLAALVGHWRCTVAGRHAAERYYFLFPRPKASRTLYGREDTVEPDGQPSESFERIVQRADGSATLEAVEGSGDAPPGDAAPLRFAENLTGDGFTLSYSVDGDSMQRVAANKRTTLDSEKCARVPEKAPNPHCAQPNERATVLEAAEPEYPMAARASRATGTVYILVTLDDRSRVVWTEVLKSDNHVFDEEAVRSARFTTYRTQISDCRPVPATYVFSVSFDR
jgi:TonB family protein